MKQSEIIEYIQRLPCKIEALKEIDNTLNSMGLMCQEEKYYSHTNSQIFKYINEEEVKLLRDIIDKLQRKHYEYRKSIGLNFGCDDMGDGYCLDYDGALKATQVCINILKEDGVFR